MDQYDYQQMQMMGMPGQYYPMAQMPQQQLEAMYPKSYYIIQPAVEESCDKMTATYGQMFTPTHEQLETMIDDIYNKIEVSIEVVVKQSTAEHERQFFGSGRRILRDFIGALLIANLLRRRRPYYGYGYGYPGFFGGSYSPYYGGYPGY